MGKDQFEWNYLPDVTVDAKGRYIVASAYSGKVWITCLDPSLQVVWSNRDLSFDSDHTRVTAAHDGRLYIWQPGRHSAVVLDEGGKQIGKLGSRERPDAKVPALELTDAEDFVVDVDGTYLMVVCDRLQRFDADGNGIHTWPQTGLRSMFNNRLEPLYRHVSETERHRNNYEHSGVVYWKRRPLGMYAHDIRAVVAGGALYLLSEYGGNDNAVGKFDRQGRCLWSIKIPEIDRTRPAVDAAGNVYVMTERKYRHRVHKIAADGSRDDVIAEDWRDGGPVDDPKWITATPDGTVGLWDTYGEVTLIGPDRQVTYVSPAQKKDTDAHIAARQKKIANDEEVD